MPPAVPADVDGAVADPGAAAGVPAEKEDDLYTKLKTLQRQLEFLDIQEEYIKVGHFEMKGTFAVASARRSAAPRRTR